VRAMTIGVGFRCSDGVVLGCDSQMTAGSDKWKEKKIVNFPQLGLKNDPYFVYASDDADFAKNAVNRLAESIQCAEKGNSEVVPIIRAELKRIHKEYCRIYPKKEDRPIADLLFTLREPSLALFRVRGIEVTPIGKADYIGIGESVARATADPLFLPTYATHETARLALYALFMAKEYVGFIDKPFHIVQLRDIPNSDLIPSPRTQWLEEEEMERMEQDFKVFLAAISPVLRSCYFEVSKNPELDNFEEKLKTFSKRIRTQHQKYIQRAKRLRKELDQLDSLRLPREEA